MERHGITFHCYADDTQLYLEFDLKDTDSLFSALEKIEICIKAIRDWMTQNLLKFNDSKLEFVVIIPRHYQAKFANLTPKLHVGDVVLHPSPTARNLGVLFDSEMSFKAGAWPGASMAISKPSIRFVSTWIYKPAQEQSARWYYHGLTMLTACYMVLITLPSRN